MPTCFFVMTMDSNSWLASSLTNAEYSRAGSSAQLTTASNASRRSVHPKPITQNMRHSSVVRRVEQCTRRSAFMPSEILCMFSLAGSTGCSGDVGADI